jgi:hypothetical protein
MGNMKDDYNGILPDVLDGITKTLGEHLQSTLLELKRSNPEIGTVFDELINGSSDKIIYSSGICQSIKQGFDNRSTWDEGLQTVWNNLTRHYPDYFSDTDKELSFSNLDLLGNMQKVNRVIKNVSSEKDNIFNERKSKLINDTKNGLLKYKDKLIDYSEKQLNKIKNTDAGELKQKKTKLSLMQQQATAELNEEYYDLVDELSYELKDKLIETLDRCIANTQGAVKDTEGQKTDTYEEKKDGCFAAIARWLGTGGYKTKTRTYTTVRVGAATTLIKDVTRTIENKISSQSQKYIAGWKSKTMSKISVVLKNNSANACLDWLVVRKTIREIINSAKWADLHYSSLADDLRKAETQPHNIREFIKNFFKKSFSETGTLTETRAEQFMDQAQDVLSKFHRTVNHDINQYSKNLKNSLMSLNPSDKIFASFKEQIEELEKQLKTKELTVAHFERIIKSLKSINL